MTLPYERTNALLSARDFLLRLMLSPSAGGLERIRSEIRAEARGILKHFPMPHEMQIAAEECPSIFGSPTRSRGKED
jgi:hypothetical protein